MKPKVMVVKAAPLPDPALAGKARVVKEGTSRRYITEHQAIAVPVTTYYLRKLAAGELVICKKAPTIELPAMTLDGDDLDWDDSHTDEESEL